MKYTFAQLEDAVTTTQSAGWPVIMAHVQESINTYIDQLIESNDSEDEILKGKIQALRRDVFNIKDEFATLHEAALLAEKGSTRPGGE